MRPIEIIHSIERIDAARELQDALKHDPHRATGNLNMQEIQDTVQIQQHSIQAAEESQPLDPDAKGQGSPEEEKKEQESNQEPEEESEDSIDKEDSTDGLGDNLDLMA